MIMKFKVLYLSFLMFIFSSLFADESIPFPSSVALAPVSALNSNSKNMFNIYSGFGKSLLSVEYEDMSENDSTEIIESYLFNGFTFNVTYNNFSLLFNLNLFTSVDGTSEFEAKAGVADSSFSLGYTVLNRGDERFVIGPMLILPTGKSENFTGEGALKGGLVLWYENSYYVNYRVFSSFIMRKIIETDLDDYGHEVLVGLKAYKNVFDNFGLSSSLLFSTDTGKFLDKYHNNGTVSAGVIYLSKHFSAEAGGKFGIGKSPFVPSYELYLSLSAIDIF